MFGKINRTAIAMFLTIFLTVSGLVMVPTTKASPTITAFFEDLASFNAAAGSPPIVVDFDDISPNTDITGLTNGGVTFDVGNQPAPSAPLIVVRAADTYTPPGFDWSHTDNKLYATSGENVLSPGGIELAPGPNPLKENDDLKLSFSTPILAIGFDILYQSLDGDSETAITLLDAADNILYHNNNIPIPRFSMYSPGGTTFVGFVSDSCNIAEIIISEWDENNVNPDSNIGFDTIRILAGPPPLSVFIGPLSASISVGQSVAFTSTVTGGTSPYSYQWYLDGNPVSGAMSASWTFTPTVSGIYYVHLKVTDAKSNTTQSETARIVVEPVPVGGYSVPIQVQTKTEPVLPYIALIAALTAIFTTLRPKTRRKR